MLLVELAYKKGYFTNFNCYNSFDSTTFKGGMLSPDVPLSKKLLMWLLIHLAIRSKLISQVGIQARKKEGIV